MLLDWLTNKVPVFQPAPQPQIPLLAYGQPGQGDLPSRYATPNELRVQNAMRRSAPPLPEQPGMRLYPGGPLLREYIGPHATQGVENLLAMGNFMPVIGDAMSARDALTYGYDAAKSGAQGNWGDMGLSLAGAAIAAIGAIPGAPNMAGMFDNAANAADNVAGAADNAASAADNVATADNAGLLGAAARNWQSELDNMGGDWTRATVIDDAGNVLHNPIGEWDGTGTRLAVRVMPDGSVRKGFIAYHGSPHDFDQFDLSKIGTGEGAQAYGPGLYFAENEGVARGYRDALAKRAKPTFKLDAEQIRPELADLGFDPQAIEMARDFVLSSGGDGFRALDGLSLIASNTGNKTAKEAAAVIRAFRRSVVAPSPGHMYEVNIAANPDDFLDWDKPLAEWPAKQREAAKKLIEAASNDAANGPDALRGMILGPDGTARYRTPDDFETLTGAELEQMLAKTYGRGDIARDKYLEAGIPGIKYLDAGSRGKGVAHIQLTYRGQPYGDPIPAHAWNQVDEMVKDYKAKGFGVEVKDLGTRNYVVFNDKLISIIRKYGLAALGLPTLWSALAENRDNGT